MGEHSCGGDTICQRRGVCEDCTGNPSEGDHCDVLLPNIVSTLGRLGKLNGRIIRIRSGISLSNTRARRKLKGKNP
jgi:hypothetical protein